MRLLSDGTLMQLLSSLGQRGQVRLIKCLNHTGNDLLECLPQEWTASLDSIFNHPPPAPTSHNAAIELLLYHTKWLPQTSPQQQPQQDQQHQHGAIQPTPDPLSLSSPTFTVHAATNLLMQPSQTARMEAWQQYAGSAVSSYPTRPHPAAGRSTSYSPGHSKGAPSVSTPGMEAPVGEQLEGSLVHHVAPAPTWCGAWRERGATHGP